MSDNKFRVTELSEEDENYLEGYPSVYKQGVIIENPEFLAHLVEFPEFKFGIPIGYKDPGLNPLIHEILIRIGKATDSNYSEVAESIGPSLVLNDLVSGDSKILKYYRLN